MTKFVAILGLALISIAAAEDPPKAPAPAPEVRALIDLSRAVMPELAASTLLNIVDSGKAPGRDLQRSLIEEAFGYASRARAAFRVAALPGVPPDTRAMFTSRAHERLELDALTLESRAVKAMLSVDRKAAREMLARIDFKSRSVPCQSVLIPDASAVFELLSSIAQSTFNDEEKAAQEHVRFLLSWLSRAASAGELAAFIDGVEGVGLKPGERELMDASIAARLESMPADYRSFATGIEALREQMDRMIARGAPPAILASAARQFFTVQLRASRCEELPAPSQAVEWFNTKLRGELPPISEDEMKPEKREEPAKPEPYFTSGPAKQISELFQKLRANRRAPEARVLQSDLLSRWNEWSLSAEKSPIDYFHQKAMVLRGLLDLNPEGEERLQLLRVCASFLAGADVQTSEPIEWLWQAHQVLDAGGPQASAIFAASGTAAMSLLAAEAAVLN